MSRKKDKKYWNYRIVTKLWKYDSSEKRLFSVTEVFYDEGKPTSYIDPEQVNILYNVESIKSLKWIRKKLKKTLKKSILDLDNWPNKWKYSCHDKDKFNT